MRRIPWISVVLCIGLLLVQCSEKAVVPQDEIDPGNSNPVSLGQTELELAARGNTFGFKLFRKIISQEEDTNIFISPLSVSMALGMTLNGANGDTEEAMEHTLELTGLTSEEINEGYRNLIDFLLSLDPNVRFGIANSIWTKLGFPIQGEFLNVNRDYFDAEVRELDFGDPASVDIINGWVNEKTNGKIEKVLEDEIPPDMVMYLINALYFKGAWTTEFDPENTFDFPFYLSDGTTMKCKMMARADSSALYLRSVDFQAVELPYGNGDYSMIILLPNWDVSLDQLVAGLSDDNWSAWMASLTPTEVELFIPKFKIEYDLTMNDVLEALGMTIAFDPYRADFTGMNPCNCLYLDFVQHNTFVEVNEEGTEAAAVTTVGIGYTGIGPTTPVFMADRPFAFAIRDRCSGSILFMGKVARPVL
jgi:serpin B